MKSVLYLKYAEIIDVSLHFPMKVLRFDLVNLSCLNCALHTQKLPDGVVVMSKFKGLSCQHLGGCHINIIFKFCTPTYLTK